MLRFSCIVKVGGWESVKMISIWEFGGTKSQNHSFLPQKYRYFSLLGIYKSEVHVLFPYFAKFTFDVSRSPLCQIVRWDCRILTLSVCMHNLPIPQFYFSIMPNCLVHSTLWTVRMSFKLPTISEVWMFLLICFCWAPENHTAPVISVFFPQAA